MKKITVLCAIILLAGCTVMNVKPVNFQTSGPIHQICIQNNPKVAISDFQDVLRKEFGKRNIATRIYEEGRMPAGCEFTLEYVAFRSWDIVPYMTQAKLELFKNNQRIGQADYHLRGKGGLNFGKWRGTQTKLAPLIGKLLGENPQPNNNTDSEEATSSDDHSLS